LAQQTAQSAQPATPPRNIEDVLNRQGLPANLEAERTLLGAVLLNNDLFESIYESLKPEHFFLPAHQKLYRAVAELRSDNRPADLISLTDYLAQRGEIEAVGGHERVAELVAGIPLLDSVEHYAQIIRDRAVLRNLIQRSSAIITGAYTSSESPQIQLAQAERAILEIGDEALKTSLRGLGDLAPTAMETLDRLMQRGEHVTGIPTKFTALDEMTSGFQRSDFIIIAARPSVGKTAFTLSLALNAAKQGHTVALFSLEMSAEQLFFRLLSMESRVDLQMLRTGRVPKNRQTEVGMIIERLAQLPIFIDDSPWINLLEVGAKLRRLSVQQPVDLVLIDYLQLIRPVGRSESRNQEVSAISRGLKALAKDMNVPVVALSQLSRAPEKRGEGKEPILSDLRDSGSLEQDADLVLFLHRNFFPRDEDDAETRARAKLIIAKQRNGPTGPIRLTFLERQAQFVNYEGDYQGEYHA
jgi:replicative DNA helicase